MSDTPRTHFIQDIVNEHNASGEFGGRVITRFPPEPNGYLHIGHAKSICLNFGLGIEYGGRCHMRFDDTNPTKEEQEYVDSILADIRWLGFDWGQHLYYASDYFQQLYEWALLLIKAGKAYVDDQTADQIRENRGTLTKPGRNSPFRERSVAENLDLFERMKKGEFPDGTRTLRAKIDMASPNLNLRDPVLYRILHAHHHRTGDAWCIYAMYDYAHGQSDWIEGITHSICTLEFENHRPLYDWCLDTLIALGAKSPNAAYRPQQFEFARLNLTYTVMSKRRLLSLVKEGHVNGWDDPRMPTLAGFRRRGYTPEAIREFCRRIGVAKFYSVIDIQVLEGCLREDLNKRAPRVMGVLRPLKVVIENYPEGQSEELDAVNNPEDASAGTRKVPFGRDLYIEQDDFREDPPKQFFRMAPGREVRLRYAYFIKCTGVIRDAAGNVIELRATYDPATRGGDSPDGRKVKATLHWVSAKHAIPCEVRLYDHLFTKPDPDDVGQDVGSQPSAVSHKKVESQKSKVESAVDAVDADEIEEVTPEPTAGGPDWRSNLNPKSLEVIPSAMLEPGVAGSPVGKFYQFERHGYFNVDPDSRPNTLVFNRTVTLKDTWAKIEKKSG